MTDNLGFTARENIKLRKENDDLHDKLRVANNRIAHLKFEFDSLSQDAGEEIHKWMVRAKRETFFADGNTDSEADTYLSKAGIDADGFPL